MQKALNEARLAAAHDEVPVGAVIVQAGEIVGRGYNQVEQSQDASAHAEIVALRDASKQLNSWRLVDCELYVTLEPCTMCIGALQLARIRALVFGCRDGRAGAVGSCFNLAEHSAFGREIKVTEGVLEEESRALLKEFFEKRRAMS